MNRKRKENDEELARSLREVPFRFIAQNHKLDENFFLKKVYQDRRYSGFFLGPNCQKKFTEAGKVLMSHSLTQIQDMVQEKEDRRLKRKMQKDDSEHTITYSNVVSSSATSITSSPVKDHDFTLLFNKKKKSPNELFRERLANFSPSAITEDFKSYSQIDFDNDDIVMASSEFGIYHTSLVDLFLQQMIYDERIIVGIILYGNSSVHKAQRELYKKFATSFCNDCEAPISEKVFQFPELPTLSSQYGRSKLIKKT